VIYPKYAAFAEAQTGNSPTQLWGLEIDHTGISCVTRCSAWPPPAALSPGVCELVLVDWCSGAVTGVFWGAAISCIDGCSPVTGDYVGTPPNPLTGDGTIYPAYDPSYAAAGNSTFQLSDSTECSYYSCDHSSDYVGSASNGELHETRSCLHKERRT
jgi:hypothetical protein